MIAIARTRTSNRSYDRGTVMQFHEKWNAECVASGVTGYVSWSRKSLFQYLEGPENAIDEMLSALETEEDQTESFSILRLGSISSRRFSQWEVLDISGGAVPDIRIQDLIDDVMSSVNGKGYAEEESRRLMIDMLDQMAEPATSAQAANLPVYDDVASSAARPYVAVLGASAGGLSPLQAIMRSLDVEMDAAIIVIQHGSSDSESLMDVILKRDTSMAVSIAEHDMPIKAGCVYIVPGGHNVELGNGKFILDGQQGKGARPLASIDYCFRALAREYGDKAVAVVLSGSGSDGARGAKVVNEAGGIVLVQSIDSSDFDSMPKATIDAGVAHQELAPAEIAEFLNNLDERFLRDSLALQPERRDQFVNQVVELLKDINIDFSGYKSETLFRRIERRRVQANVSTETDYLELLRKDDQEKDELREDILVTVTSFFRDPEAWEALKDSVVELIKGELKPGDTFRVWVAACASGEEVYTLAIILSEVIDDLDINVNFKIFATDIERRSLRVASDAHYSDRSLENIGSDRREKYFTKKTNGYVVVQSLRDNIIFEPHNFVKNAPFTRIHLVTCRNALIYMQPDLQQLAIKMLHFALHVNGILFLGPSETLGNLQSEFYPVNRRWNQFRKLRNLRLPLHLMSEKLHDSSNVLNARTRLAERNHSSDDKNVYAASLDALAKYSGKTIILVDNARLVVMLVSDPHGLLQVHKGAPTLDVVKMVPSGLRSTLTFALARAFKDQTHVVYRAVSCAPTGQDERDVDVEVFPHQSEDTEDSEQALVVLSNNSLAEHVDPYLVSGSSSASERDQIAAMRTELSQTKEALRAAMTDLEGFDYEQRSINEQLSAANEELQSTNEELQSVNEELYTVNFEYQSKIQELSELNQDLDNLLESANLGVIFLDADLRIRRFTEVSTHTVNLIPTDIGRPLLDLAHNLYYADLVSDLRRVLSMGKSINREITRKEKGSPKLSIGMHPYRATGGLAQGVLIMFRENSEHLLADVHDDQPELSDH